MNLDIKITEKIITIVGKDNVFIDEPMKKHTTFRIGGPADLLVCPKNYEMVKEIINLCNKEHINYFILGNGSNLIVKDGGIRGVVISLSELNNISIKGTTIEAEAGAMLSKVSREATNASLTGLEFASGIPGTIGGGLTMNAGAYDGDMSKVVVSALVLKADTGEIFEVTKEDLELSYRMSSIEKNNYIILKVKLELHNGDYETINARVNELSKMRTEKQPLRYPSAGSVFKRPTGYFAGKLIQDCGLKGVHIGDAEVSEKHSGFIINKGNASASDVLNLIKLVQARVFEKFKVQLSTEIKVIGEDS